MPNWCDNRLTVSGNHIDVKRLLEHVRGDREPFSLEKIVPTPKEMLEKGWYHWRLDNWGTKWDVNEPILYNAYNEDGEYEREFEFETAWSPPSAAIHALSIMFPNLTIILEFEEAMNDFSGQIVYRNGAVLSRLDGNYGVYRIHEDDWYEDED